MQSPARIPAAQYVRMSTEDQQYSIENQKAAIKEHADRFGYSIEATYADSGKSGVSIKNRSGLRSLLKDVVSGCVAFKVILVYDISRWGRFQDTDEAAHYEFICKNAGVPVRYCAEQFENDGSMPSSVMKALKRTMAGEYSRELGVKVYRGQRNLVLLGFKVGGPATYGLRRMLVSPDGRRKHLLKPSERKYIKSDRVILVAGPRKEVECVRKIFSMGVSKRNTPGRISAELNRQGLKFAGGRPWDEQLVFRILKNPIYTGCNTWGRTTRPLGRSWSRVHPESWVTKPGAFVAIVDQATFDRAQRAIQRRKTYPKKPDEYLLNGMKRVLERKGKLTEKLLEGQHIFDHKTYYRRFGSVIRAYQLIGYEPSAFVLKCTERQKRLRRLRADLLLRLKQLFPEHVRTVHLTGDQREVIEIDRHFRIAIHICRPGKSTVSGKPRWVLLSHPLENSLPALICTVGPELNTLLSYYVVPEVGNAIKKSEALYENHPVLALGQKLEGLTQFYETAKKIAVECQEKDDITVVGDVTASARTSTITVAQDEISLPPIGAGIFKLLLLNAGQIVSRDRLCHPMPGREIRHLTAHVCNLRRKLGISLRKRIQTVPGSGYVYATPDSERSFEQNVKLTSL